MALEMWFSRTLRENSSIPESPVLLTWLRNLPLLLDDYFIAGLITKSAGEPDKVGHHNRSKHRLVVESHSRVTVPPALVQDLNSPMPYEVVVMLPLNPFPLCCLIVVHTQFGQQDPPFK